MNDFYKNNARSISEVTGLFTHQTSDASLFARLQWILLARTGNDRVYMELVFDGGTPPPNWLTTLTCEVDDPVTGYKGSAKLEVATQEKTKGNRSHLLVRTMRLSPSPPDGGWAISSLAAVRIISSSNLIKEKPRRALLAAVP